MLCVIHRCQNVYCQKPTYISQPFLLYNERDLCNDYISKGIGNNDRFCINFPCHCVLGHVLLDTDPIDDVGSWKEVVQPTKKPRSAGPHKSKLKKITTEATNNKKIRQKNKKSKSVIIQIPEKPRSVKIPEKPKSVKITMREPEELRSTEEASMPQRIVSMDGHPKNRLYINSGASIHILFNK